MKTLLAVLQYGDSGYPAGAYAHSFGIEAAVEAGFVGRAGDLDRAVRSILRSQTARTDAVGAAACARAAADCDTRSLLDVDQRLTAARAASEARRASSRIGRQMLETVAVCEHDIWLDELHALARSGETDGNFAAIAGAILGRTGASPDEAAAMVLWCGATGMTNAAIRLGVVTHLEAQQILSSLRSLIVDLADASAGAEAPRLGGVVPLFEVLSMQHEVAETRLFAS